jgi:hypothetical protein
MNIFVSSWDSIKSSFINGSLIIGNGASIEIHSAFDYRILHIEAVKRQLITSIASNIFSQFSTTNFEIVLKHLARSSTICQLLNETSAHVNISSKYQEIRNALYLAIHSIHPNISNQASFQNFSTTKALESKVLFLENFRTIISLNYDVILYWMIMWAMKNYSAAKKTHSASKFNVFFKDCFAVTDEKHDGLLLDPNPTHLRENIQDSRTVTLIFYAHGNLVLANDVDDGVPFKIKANYNLLETINEKWISGKVTPLIVCEGDTESKLKSIESNPYTSFVFHGILPNISSANITILGWSLDKSDQHILRQILRNQPRKIAISYHNSPDQASIQKRIQSTWDGMYTDKNTGKLSVT